MIYGLLAAPPVTGELPVLAKALAFLRQPPPGGWQEGRYELEGEQMFALVSRYATEPATERRPESHRRYIDIQYVAAGEEVLGHSFLGSGHRLVEDLSADKDLLFYDGAIREMPCLLNPDVYAVLFPEDVHRPCCQSGQAAAAVTKIVIKIDAAYWARQK